MAHLPDVVALVLAVFLLFLLGLVKARFVQQPSHWTVALLLGIGVAVGGVSWGVGSGLGRALH